MQETSVSNPEVRPFPEKIGGLDEESRSRGGKRSGETRRRRKAPDQAARAALLRGARAAAGVVSDVAQATNGFEEVKPDLRFKAALVVLEYVLGKPKGFDLETDEEAPGPQTFEDLLRGSPVEEPAS